MEWFDPDSFVRHVCLASVQHSRWFFDRISYGSYNDLVRMAWWFLLICRRAHKNLFIIYTFARYGSCSM